MLFLPVVITQHFKQRPNKLRKERQKIDARDIIKDIEPTGQNLTNDWVDGFENIGMNLFKSKYLLLLY